MRIRTTERYDREIKALLKKQKTAVTLYAAARIEELEAQCEALLKHIVYLHTEERDG